VVGFTLSLAWLCFDILREFSIRQDEKEKAAAFSFVVAITISVFIFGLVQFVWQEFHSELITLLRYSGLSFLVYLWFPALKLIDHWNAKSGIKASHTVYIVLAMIIVYLTIYDLGSIGFEYFVVSALVAFPSMLAVRDVKHRKLLMKLSWLTFSLFWIVVALLSHLMGRKW
jgi:hypothetical protein